MPTLPDFDILAVDRRFVAELERLRLAGAFSSYIELAPRLEVQDNFVSQIERGRYHCNLKLLYLLRRACAEADTDWVLYGAAHTGRPEPAAFPERPKRGRPARVH